MSTMPIRTFRKTVVERRRLYLDYDCWLAETEKLGSLQVVIIPFTSDAPLTVNSGFADAGQRKVMFYVGGGKSNTNYTLQMIVGTDQGQTKRDDLGIRVFP
jgi:hypothetical protein